jgi:hypothetical protein
MPALWLERLGQRFREVGHRILVISSLWLVLSSLMAWVKVDGKVVGLAQALDNGVTWWSVIMPLVAIVSLVALWRRPPGIYFLLCILAFILFFVSSLNLAYIEETVESVGLAWGTITAPLVWLVCCVIALVLGLGEAVPLDAPLARLVYLERFKHLQSLCRLAERRGWKTRGPEMPHHALRVRGEWNGRELYVESAEMYNFQAGTCHLTMATSSKRVLWPFFVGVDLPGPGKDERQSALSSTCRNARGKAVPFYLWTPPDQSVTQESLASLGQVLDQGRDFLRARTQVYTVSDAIIFDRRYARRMTENEQDIERLAQWLGDIARVMEETGLSTFPERDDWWTWN